MVNCVLSVTLKGEYIDLKGHHVNAKSRASGRYIAALKLRSHRELSIAGLPVTQDHPGNR